MSRKNNHWVKQSSDIWLKDYKQATALILLNKKTGLYGVMVKTKQSGKFKSYARLQATLHNAKKYADEVVKGL